MTNAQAERLDVLVEELAEAIHAASKCKRHGYDSTHKDYQNVLNQNLLEKELGHAIYAIEMLINAGDVAGSAIADQTQRKWQGNRYLHHQQNVERPTTKK